MKTKLLSLTLLLAFSSYSIAQELPESGGSGAPIKFAPIDTYQVVLIVAAVLLTVGVVAYKKLSLKKA